MQWETHPRPDRTPVAEQSREECLVQDINLVLTGQKAQGCVQSARGRDQRKWARKQAGSNVNRQNIERYRRLADETTNATERLRVIKLLAEERAKFKLEFKMRDVMARRGMACVKPFEPDREEQLGAD